MEWFVALTRHDYVHGHDLRALRAYGKIAGFERLLPGFAGLGIATMDAITPVPFDDTSVLA